MYNRTAGISSPVDLLCRLREQQRMIARSLSYHNHMDDQILRSALQLYLSSACGCRAVMYHNPYFNLTVDELQTSSYDCLICKLDSIINSLDYITNQHGYHDDHYRSGICQGPGLFGRTIYTHHTHQHQHQHQHPHPQHQHGLAAQQSFSFFDRSGSESNHTHPHGAPRGPNTHGHG